MAKYDVTYSCGHEGTIGVFGPEKDRQWKVDRISEGLCPECAKKEREEQRRKENEEAAKIAAEKGYVELEGTEKQVKWANSIRESYVKLIQSSLDFTEGKTGEASIRRREKLARQMEFFTKEIRKAKTFIEIQVEGMPLSAAEEYARREEKQNV